LRDEDDARKRDHCLRLLRKNTEDIIAAGFEKELIAAGMSAAEVERIKRGE
jgi:hypothetical protein